VGLYFSLHCCSFAFWGLALLANDGEGDGRWRGVFPVSEVSDDSYPTDLSLSSLMETLSPPKQQQHQQPQNKQTNKIPDSP